jgi:hypothetical protein
MQSRNMIQANTEVFSALDEYCLRRGEPLSNAGKPRWIGTDNPGKAFLKYATLIEELSFSASVKVARFDFYNRAFFVTIGLDAPEAPNVFQVEHLDGGRLTAVLSELKPTPVVLPSQIRDVVEVADKASSSSYGGHDHHLVSGLYPKIQVLSVADLLREESFKMFFLICLADRRRIEQWIDEQLATILNMITELSPAYIPYEILCRSVLDMDPSALFLALYRCLEALYAHTQTQRLMTALEISKPWAEMAETLEAALGWYPREEPSLEALLAHAVAEDLQAIAAALNDTIPAEARSEPYVAKRIYQLRNALVHYRPFHQKFPFKEVDWNRLCEAMALLVFHIYGEINKSWEPQKKSANLISQI